MEFKKLHTKDIAAPKQAVNICTWWLLPFECIVYDAGMSVGIVIIFASRGVWVCGTVAGYCIVCTILTASHHCYLNWQIPYKGAAREDWTL